MNIEYFGAYELAVCNFTLSSKDVEQSVADRTSLKFFMSNW